MSICECIGEAEEMPGNEEQMKARLIWYWWGLIGGQEVGRTRAEEERPYFLLVGRRVPPTPW